MTPPQRIPKQLADDSSNANPSLGATAENFANRMQRRLKEQELKETESKKALQARHVLMLQAMTTIRKALVSTSRIQLGSRFSFDLEVNDWEGWPRVELNLIDSLAPQRIEHALIITANDRKNLGTVQISTKGGEPLARLHLEQPSEMEKLPLILKKAVRHFLDLVGAYVLNPPSAQEVLEVQTKSLGASDFDCISHNLQDKDLFQEDAPIGDANTVDSFENISNLTIPIK
jgi:hypothetical protein